MILLTVNTDVITTMISTVGFPIVCCGAMFWLTNQLRQEHREESAKFTEAIERNTMVLQKLTDKLEGENGK